MQRASGTDGAAVANGAATAWEPGSEDELNDDDEPDLTTRDRIFVAAKVEMRRRAEEWIAKVRERGGLAGPQSNQRPVLSKHLEADQKERDQAPPARRQSSRPARVKSVTRLKVPVERLLADEVAPPSQELADLRAELAEIGDDPTTERWERGTASPPEDPTAVDLSLALDFAPPSGEVELPVPSVREPPVVAEAPAASSSVELPVPSVPEPPVSAVELPVPTDFPPPASEGQAPEPDPPMSRAHPADAFSRRPGPASGPPSKAHPADAFSRRPPPASEPPSSESAPVSRAHPADAFSRRPGPASGPPSKAHPADAFSRRPPPASEPPSERPRPSGRARPADAFRRRPAPPSSAPPPSSRTAHPADAFSRRPPPESEPPDRAATQHGWTTGRPSRRRHSSAAFSRGDELSGLPSAAVRHFQAAVDAHLKRDYELALWEIEAAIEIVPGNRTFELNRSRILETIARRRERERQ